MTQALQDQIVKVDKIMVGLKETVSAEEKQVVGLLANTPAGQLRELLTKRLQVIQSQGSMDQGEAIKAIETAGLTVVAILRMGLSKWRNQNKWSDAKREKDAAEKEANGK